MSIRTRLAFILGKSVSKVSKLFRIGTGITWGGEIALRVDPNILKFIKSVNIETIVVSGTNGKTTTASMIAHVLKNQEYEVIHNDTGANLVNGLVGTFIAQYNKYKNDKKCIVVFEVDEAEFYNVVPILCPKYIVLLNLFRDQLDRYGEVNTIASKWTKTLKKVPKSTNLIVNADDPLVAYIGITSKLQNYYYGVDDSSHAQNKLAHAVDSIYCPRCGKKLTYKRIYLSHYGDWSCSYCRLKRPNLTKIKAKSKLEGLYNLYNTLAVYVLLETLGISKKLIADSLESFTPVFGRQEEVIISGKQAKILLSKNPTGFNENIRTILGNKDMHTILLVLNDRTPDGTDISWIWDVDFEKLTRSNCRIICSGDRAYDMGLRIKYCLSTMHELQNTKYFIETDYKKALRLAVSKTGKNQKLYILPTYSAMLDVRKYIVGKKIS